MMTLGELKVNCYRLIDPNDTEIYVDQIEDVYEKDETYSIYFLNMLPSINIAITRIVQACILPLRMVDINAEDIYKENEKLARKNIDLSKYASDIFKVKKVEYVDEYGNYNRLSHRLIGNLLDTETKKNGVYRIFYYPRINSVESYYNDNSASINDIDLNELGLDDNILSIIPYAVKADLLEVDKAVEATISRNVFEQYLSSYEMDEIEMHNVHKSWWGGIL